MKNILRIILAIIVIIMLMMMSTSCTVYRIESQYVTFSDCPGSSDTISVPAVLVQRHVWRPVLKDRTEGRKYTSYGLSANELSAFVDSVATIHYVLPSAKFGGKEKGGRHE